MPAFVKSSKDENLWDRAKKIAQEHKGKKELQGDDFALANHIFHKMKFGKIKKMIGK